MDYQHTFHDKVSALVETICKYLCAEHGIDEKEYFSKGGCGEFYFHLKKFCQCAKPYKLESPNGSHYLTRFGNQELLYDINYSVRETNFETTNFKIVNDDEVPMFNFGVNRKDTYALLESGTDLEQVIQIKQLVKEHNENFFNLIQTEIDKFIETEFNNPSESVICRHFGFDKEMCQ